MVAWLPVLKASLPYITQVVSVAIPAFTSKPESSKADPVVAKQIEELQLAVTKNAESVRGLAEQLQETIRGLEAAAADAQRQVSVFKTMLMGATIISIIALGCAIWALVH